MEIRRACLSDVGGIMDVCSEGYRKTYESLISQHDIEKIIAQFYNKGRIKREILTINRGWNGWFVADDHGKVVGAGGGGFTDDKKSELFVLYLDPSRKREGIGTKLLDAITDDQINHGATEQWVSVFKGNTMGISFYEAMGFECQCEGSTYALPEREGFVSLRYRRLLWGGADHADRVLP
ncbi:GNAT family N-acetyltransferase [Sporolactobacillus shoreicorticis]|uniref:GNAT family N-acetyltransferase n=1 Tax=Sporolactobacillus shoreicorticis TaxID=1923877 RepID=A0ABW5S1L8_9BACL|nr:GNAT family N-acetyltransferase [Sporolactobacillus shoreicorticis]MCO7126446.1 GNAT family N-acetyltransferase [Sporolactobacillus shoreicorticis]